MTFQNVSKPFQPQKSLIYVEGRRSKTIGRESTRIKKAICRCFFVGLLLVNCAFVQEKAGTSYPNELKNFKFYKQHLAPLRPYISDRNAIVQLFKSGQGKELADWRIVVLYVGDYKDSTVHGHLWTHTISGRLASLDVIPKKRISMLGVHFPAAFKHSFGEVSEINVTCDVYTDAFGLQYWIYSEDSETHKKGDLMEIVYGPSKRLRRKVEGEQAG